jgi:dTDP-glucose 4,6-dehydratase
MKLLVTGGAGFIGSNFIHYWLENHPRDQIVNLDKLTYAGNLANLKDVQNNPNYKFIRGDIADADTVGVAMQHVDLVANFAAETHVDRSILGPAVFITTNVVGTQVLLNAALEQKVKLFLQVSTDEVYGDLPFDSEDKFNEDSCYRPSSPYAASKAAADHLVRAYHRTYNLPAIITNCSNNYGPYQFPEKLIPLAITNLLEGKKAPMYDRGQHIRDWLYVEDHCRALDAVIHQGKVGETYCIGGLTQGITNREVLQKIGAILGKDLDQSVVTVADRPGHDRKYAIDWSKINSELGWQPLHDFDTGLKKTVEWYKDNKLWLTSLKTTLT